MAVRTNLAHWGAYEVDVDGGRITGVRPHPLDPDPTPLHGNIASAFKHPARVARPAVRAGWLERGPGPDDRRGTEPFVEVPWDEVLDRLAAELDRVRRTHGNSAIFAGSYGWASPGRFHHAQTQLHRFANAIGGFTASAHTYSVGASEVVLPHIVGPAMHVIHSATSLSQIAEHTDLIVSFGGIPRKNSAVAPGGVTRHLVGGHLARAAERGCRFVLFGPVRDDLAPGAEWHPLRPGTDTAVMLALCFVLDEEGLANESFLKQYCTGSGRFFDYVRGVTDGTPKTPEWAAAISGIDAGVFRPLARRMAAGRTMVTTSWSLQRADHGEQPVWAMVALAATLGQIGLPGGGFGHGYGAQADVGADPVAFPRLTLPRGSNPVKSFIPVARIADLLLRPGEPFEFNGEQRSYPDIRLVYWAGGNPFHHHQDLGRLHRAFCRPDTVIVHEPYWTSTARQADIVLPTTTTLERDDIGAGPNDPFLLAMQAAVAPHRDARHDFDILAALADRLGATAAFTEGRDAGGWLRHLYDRWRTAAEASTGERTPTFDEFWERGVLELPTHGPTTLLGDFRADPEAHRLPTPSGRIELFSERVAGFGYDDCPGHPAWLEPAEWLGSPLAERFPLQLVANQPKARLHSQLDVGDHSQASKVAGREPVRIHPDDAAARGISAGDVVRLFNDRGACLAGAVISDAVRPGVVQLSTGAWYDPLDPAAEQPLCVHGNPNVLTFDRGTSRLGQGSVGQLALVEVERFEGPVPPVTVHRPPSLVSP